MNRTGIEYLSHTWNPVAMRCTPVSDGCANCWHLAMSKRHAANPTLGAELREARGGGAFALLEDELSAPLRLRKPARIGVQFMGDLFHESVPFEWIAAVFGIIAARGEHTFMVLTKRPSRMREFFEWLDENADDDPSITDPDCTSEDIRWLSFERARERNCYFAASNTLGFGLGRDVGTWPLPNLWLGVTVESPDYLWRVEELLKIPAAVRWVSYEPALAGVDWYPYVMDADRAIDWLVAGAETGPGKRAADPDWFHNASNACSAAKTPFFFKADSQGQVPDDLNIREVPQ